MDRYMIHRLANGEYRFIVSMKEKKKKSSIEIRFIFLLYSISFYTSISPMQTPETQND